MEKIGGAIFLGLVISTIAQAPPQRPNFLDHCQSVQEKSGFNKEQFFTGDWLVTNAKDGTESTLCRKYTTSVNSEGKLEVQYGSSSRSGEERKVSCTQQDGNNQAPYIFNCEVTQGEQTVLQYEVQKTIVETDGNSALLYRCLKLGQKYVDTYLILNRKKGGEVSQTVRDAISAQSLDLGKFLSRTSVTCKA